MKEATLCLLIKNEKITLAKKKRKIGVDQLNGYGGKVEPGQTIEEAAVEETFDESKGFDGSKGVIIKESDLEKVAICSFYNSNEHPDFKVHVFIVREWEGEPGETEEMGPPQEFNLDNIPYDEMMDADRLWMSLVLSGKKIKANIHYDANGEVEEFSYTETEF